MRPGPPGPPPSYYPLLCRAAPSCALHSLRVPWSMAMPRTEAPCCGPPPALPPPPPAAPQASLQGSWLPPDLRSALLPPILLPWTQAAVAAGITAPVATHLCAAA